MSLCDIPDGYEIRMRIVKALKDEMLERPAESITVASLCDRVQISRQTFYRYFKDKFDVINWYGSFFHQTALGQVGRSLTWFEGFLKTGTFGYEERDFFEGAARPRKDFNALVNYAIRTTYTDWRATLTDYIAVEITPLLEFQLSYWSKAGTEAGFRWIKDGYPTEPLEYAHNLESCVPKELYNVMNKHVLAKRKLNPEG
jgi:AcrR family transcriptional regulator